MSFKCFHLFLVELIRQASDSIQTANGPITQTLESVN
jgi:hypothetical protein